MANFSANDIEYLKLAILQNTQGLLANDWLNPHEKNYDQIVEYATELALEQLKQINQLIEI